LKNFKKKFTDTYDDQKYFRDGLRDNTIAPSCLCKYIAYYDELLPISSLKA